MIELNTIYQEPCLATLKRMQSNSIDCVITSPPYWQLRDYGYEGQWGLEPTFQLYLEHLWQMMDEIFRVLKPEGTCWINLGDTYGTTSGNIKQGNLGTNKIQYTGSIEGYKKPENMSKCLLLIPHRFAIGCIDRGWIMRNDCIWAKRNGMPESVTDRFSKKHEYFFFMVKSEKYFFDLDAIRDKHKQVSIERLQRGISENNKWVNGADGQTPHNLSQPRPNVTTKIPEEQSEMFGSPRARQHREGGERNADNLNPLGKNPGTVSDFWDIKKPTFEEYMKKCEEYYFSEDDFFDVPTKPSREKHYASYNDSLLLKPVLAGCPEGGIIYDPFIGTGKTAEVALRANRNFIGSEMSGKYCQIANKRLEPFLTQTALF